MRLTKLCTPMPMLPCPATQWGVSAANKHEAQLEWLVWVPEGATAESDRAIIEVDFQRGGVLRCEIALDGSEATGSQELQGGGGPVSSKL